MKKILMLGILFCCSIALTGCGEKQCSKWETKSNGVVQDCSKISGQYEKLYCEQKNAKIKTTEECVEWK